MLDYLNRPGRFLTLRDGARHHLVAEEPDHAGPGDPGGVGLVPGTAPAAGGEGRAAPRCGSTPGRRIVLMTSAGEREVQGPALTAADHRPVPGPGDDRRRAARPHQRARRSGRGRSTASGTIRGVAEQRPDGRRGPTFTIGAAPAAPAAARGRGRGGGARPAPRRKLSGPTAEIDELFDDHVRDEGLRPPHVGGLAAHGPPRRRDEVPARAATVLTAGGHRAHPVPDRPPAEQGRVREAQRHRLRLRARGRGPLPLQLLPRPQGRGRRLPASSRARS